MKRPSVSNADVARSLREMGLFLEMQGVPFKPQAYEKAAYAVSALDRPLSEIHAEGGAEALDALPGVGAGIARRIAGLLESGRMKDLDALRHETPIDVLGLTSIEGIGVKKAAALWRALKVATVTDLKRAARQGRVRTLPHFGARSERRILEAIDFYEEAAGRRPLGQVLEVARRIEAALAKVRGAEQVAVAGSVRRHCETVGDLDVLVAARDASRVADAFIAAPESRTLLARGPTKVVVRLGTEMEADLRIVDPESFGAALLYLTGSKAHNVALRKIALRRGLTLNEYGLYRGTRRLASRTEEEVYRALGLDWVPPEMREDRGEVELAQSHRLPHLIEAHQIRGDLQTHTSWTDGSSTVEAMAKAAEALGREYIAITDHTRDLAMTGGLTAARLRAQIKEIRKVQEKRDGIRILAGAEVNIRPDGTLDIDDATLAELDLVGAAIHSHFDQSRADMTRRILRAVENPRVDILFHPMSRSLGRRRAVDCDFETVLRACVRHGTILEVDAQPERLDLPDALVRTAIEAGARIAIDSDAHTLDELRYLETFGLGVARRAWAGPNDVVNTLPADRLLASLKRPRKTRAGLHRARPSQAPVARAHT